MNFEKIEQAYDLLLENVQTIQNQLGTNIYDAMIEQNAAYVAGQHETDLVVTNNKALKQLDLTKEEWRRAFQFLFIKANQTEPMQYNHQFTPDSIGFILTFLLDQLVPQDSVTVLEIGSGTGNLAQTILNASQKKLDYLGIEIDDLLIDLSASMADVMQAEISFAQGDAVRPQILKESQVIIADLPIGFYPDDQVASRYQVASQTEHTYAHHLLMEQSLKYLEKDGFAILLAPNDLLTSPQSDLLKGWLQEQANIVAMIALPPNLFGKAAMAKSIFVLQKKAARPLAPFVYPLQSLQEPEAIQKFMLNFKNWKQENAI
ncbi:TPA: class I SAM-dependent methyltransferase [Streptococcus suis]|uniref:class I SAM-dependent methyltransferase n=1 Tax=Streptococcus suis TaxID=1307 RepID=UPI00209AB9E3|nr:class I SAM-dependent methyltransferase [Streptococcus suis]MCO8173731.1 class I SAM-dependent methyltransferase [Streptococcus suis]MCO8182123.1 class I SAM-dependent methyltransferase [Streptococcus suis]MCO8192649.1 class I SAM-dependent methyltransferase [Streptococcus suis]MCO8223250.1 class I SAM-dependent methyltransferase [Streptococcus suis]HEM3471020.1 class I SAM-dependent methyltransferase [Streptococcus suis]